jgi:hypothetical protein
MVRILRTPATAPLGIVIHDSQQKERFAFHRACPKNRNMDGRELIRHVGEALYGDHWQRALAREIGVSDRLVRFWAAGDRELPDTLPPRLLTLLHQRGDRLSDTTQLVEQFINRGE